VVPRAGLDTIALFMNWDRSVSKVADCGLDNQGLIPAGEEFFSFLSHADQLWDSPSLPSNCY